MGSAASAALWYGVYGEIPEAASAELDDPQDNPYGEKVIDGIHIHRVWVYGNAVGAGATVAHNWWGDQTSVDLSKMDAVKSAADKFLDEYEVPGERGWFLTANYS